MNTDTPRTDAGCAPIFFNNGLSTIAADPEISRQLERELNEAKAYISQLRKSGDKLHDAIWSVQDWNGTAVGDAADEWVKVYDRFERTFISQSINESVVIPADVHTALTKCSLTP